MGLPWRTSWSDVRIVERARRGLPGSRSTASPNSPRPHGGVEVVGISRLGARRRPRVVVPFALALLLMCGACSDDGESDATATTTTSRPRPTSSTEQTTSTTAADADQAVTAAYEAANQAFIDAAAIPDPSFPAIEATHTGPMLEQRREVLRALQLDGRIIRYPADSQYRVVIESIRAEGAVARVTFCAVDDAERVDARTGDVIAGGVVTVRGEAALRSDAGVWKLAEQRFDSRTEGTASCD